MQVCDCGFEDDVCASQREVESVRAAKFEDNGTECQ